MDKNIVIRPLKYEKMDFFIYFDTQDGILFIERKVLQHVIKKPYKYISKVINHLLICEIIDSNGDIRKVKIDRKNKYLYDLNIIKEFSCDKFYCFLANYNKRLINEYNNRIYFKDGKLLIKKELINNLTSSTIRIKDLILLFNTEKDEIHEIIKKADYNIYDLIYLSFNIKTKESLEIRKYFSDIIIKNLLDFNNKETIKKNDDEIDSNIILSNKEKKKYFNNTISYNNILYDSETFINNLIISSKEEIIIISRYMNDEIFLMLKNAASKIVLYTSNNALITKYNTSIFLLNHPLVINKCYTQNETYIIIDDIVYLLDISIISIFKENSTLTKINESKQDLFKKLKI